ncbi:hypothetical protein ABPG74_019532 [Tetrahymena malaccensis]
MQFDQLTLNEVDFMIKQINLTTILPSYTEERTYNLIQGDFGPFKPNIPAKVPLWLAIHLKRSNKCRIVPPDWLNEQILTKVFDSEKQNDELQNLPYQFFEIAHILIKFCCESIPNVQKVRCVLDDIENIRETKIDNKMLKIDQNTKFVRFNNISQYEVNKKRKVLELFMDGLNSIQKVVEKNNMDISKLTVSQHMSQN